MTAGALPTLREACTEPGCAPAQDNARVMDFLFRWLTRNPTAEMRLHAVDTDEADTSEHTVRPAARPGCTLPGRRAVKAPSHCLRRRATAACPQYLPDTESLADRIRVCLQESDDLPADFTKLFDSTLFKARRFCGGRGPCIKLTSSPAKCLSQLDTSLIPEAAELYEKLGVTKAPLTLIPPQFVTPLPPLQPAVFPPVLRQGRREP